MQEITQEKSPIKQKILFYIDSKGISRYQFYKKTGITRGILDQDNGISEDNLTKFLAHFPEVSPTWLLTGNGAMLKPSESGAIYSNIKGSNGDHIVGNNIKVKKQEASDLRELVTSREQLLNKWAETFEARMSEKDRALVAKDKYIEEVIAQAFRRNQEKDEQVNSILSVLAITQQQLTTAQAQLNEAQKQISKLINA